MEHDGGELLWSNMGEGRLEATTITAFLFMLAPEWLTATVRLHKLDSGFPTGFTVAQL